MQESEIKTYSSDFKNLSILAKAVYICEILVRLEVEDLDALIDAHNMATRDDILRAVSELESKGLLKKNETIN